MSGERSVFFVLGVVFVSLANFAIASEDWCYSSTICGDKATWQGICSTGRAQSPININSSEALIRTLRNSRLRVKFSHDWCKTQSWFYLRNSGHNVGLRLTPEAKSTSHTMKGDGFNGTYYFAQLHFHWGENRKMGSEHTIDNSGYFMGIHFVHIKTPQEPEDSPLANQNVAVLGVLVQAGNYPNNTAMQPIIDVMPQVSRKSGDSVTKFNIPFNLNSLLPLSKEVFRYYGSLTTPPCSEAVVWTVFREPLRISFAQMAEFMKLQSEDGHSMNNNYRAVCATNKRKVYKYFFDRICEAPVVVADPSEANSYNDDVIPESRNMQVQKRYSGPIGVASKISTYPKFENVPES